MNASDGERQPVKSKMITIRGTARRVHADDVDLAELLLKMTTEPLVLRKDLNAQWNTLASDIAASEYAVAYSKRDRGSLVTQVLRGALRELDKLGAIQRVAQPPAVIIRDRALLVELVQAWDAAVVDSKE
ncbi:hypothetical protein GCM10022247_35840 [Allokutzneria multivorans]|uniref:Uncharacterized protein n=1 Tax=Allokutzneria multivorans TaxID=1142134 RepID=A0ABP7SE08_9PSEU